MVAGSLTSQIEEGQIEEGLLRSSHTNAAMRG